MDMDVKWFRDIHKVSPYKPLVVNGGGTFLWLKIEN